MQTPNGPDENNCIDIDRAIAEWSASELGGDWEEYLPSKY